MFLELKIQVLPNSWRCMEQKTTTAWISTFAGSLLWWLRFLLTELLRTCKIRPSKFELKSLGWLLVSRPMVSTQQACSCQSPLQTLPLLLWFLSCLFPHHLLWFSTLLRLISESPTPAKSNMTMFEDVYPIKNRDCPMLFCCFQRCKLSTLYSFHWAWIVPRKKTENKKHPGGTCHPIWAIYYTSVILRSFFRSNVTIMFVCFAALLEIRTWHSTRLANAKAAKVIKKWISNSASVDAHKRTGKWQAPWSVCWCLRLWNILSL